MQTYRLVGTQGILVVDVEQGKHQKRGQTIVSSGGVWFASVSTVVRVKALFHEGLLFPIVRWRKRGSTLWVASIQRKRRFCGRLRFAHRALRGELGPKVFGH